MAGLNNGEKENWRSGELCLNPSSELGEDASITDRSPITEHDLRHLRPQVSTLFIQLVGRAPRLRASDNLIAFLVSKSRS